MTESEFLERALCNRVNAELAARLPSLGLLDCWLVSGCLFQTVWNVVDGHSPVRGIRDYDLFYFDPDASWDAEDRAIGRARLPGETCEQNDCVGRTHFGVPSAVATL